MERRTTAMASKKATKRVRKAKKLSTQAMFPVKNVTALKDGTSNT
jgi:hypothetical protein